MKKLLNLMRQIGFVKEDLFYVYENYEICFLMTNDNKKSFMLSDRTSPIAERFIIDTSDKEEFSNKLKEVFIYRLRVNKINKLLNGKD